MLLYTVQEQRERMLHEQRERVIIDQRERAERERLIQVYHHAGLKSYA